MRTLFERLPRLVIAILLLFLSVFLLTLYFTQKGHPEYLWLALHELVQVPIGIIDQAGSSARLDNIWYGALYLQLVFISAYLYFEFLVSFLALKRRWYIKGLRYTAPILALIAPTILLVGHNKAIGVVLAIVLVCAIFWVIGWAIFVFLTLIVATIKRNFEAGLLLIPLVLTMVGIAEPILTGGMGDFGGGTLQVAADDPGGTDSDPLCGDRGLRRPAGDHRHHLRALPAHSPRAGARQRRTGSSAQRAGADDSAREGGDAGLRSGFGLQPGHRSGRRLLPRGAHAGRRSAGDPRRCGGQRPAGGDECVDADGRAAAYIGEEARREILESLNRVLIGSDSFTTCQVAWFGPDGEVVIANAGHLPPYLNTQEVSLPGGLPLGVVADVTYDEVRLYLHPGDRLLMMSDGVVEARQGSGELFGFDRVHNLSNQSAFYIADAAKAFGQEDDITVLTIRRLAKAMAA